MCYDQWKYKNVQSRWRVHLVQRLFTAEMGILSNTLPVYPVQFFMYFVFHCLAAGIRIISFDLNMFQKERSHFFSFHGGNSFLSATTIILSISACLFNCSHLPALRKKRISSQAFSNYQSHTINSLCRSIIAEDRDISYCLLLITCAVESC